MADADKLLHAIQEQAEKLAQCKDLFERFIFALHETRIDDPWFQLEDGESNVYDFDIPGAAAYVRFLWHGPTKSARIVYGFIHKDPGAERRKYVPVCHFPLSSDGTVDGPLSINDNDAPKLIHLAAVERLCRSVIDEYKEEISLS